jgi:hypothetical protein
LDVLIVTVVLTQQNNMTGAQKIAVDFEAIIQAGKIKRAVALCLYKDVAND